MVGCGSSGPSKAEIAQQRVQLTKLLSTEVIKRNETKARASESSCRAQVGRALSLLEHQPDTKQEFLSVDIGEYRARVDDIETELDRIPRGSIGERCLKVVLALSKAGSVDKDAADQWSDCIVKDAPDCETFITSCATDKPDRQFCPQGDVNLNDTYQLELSVIAITGSLIHNDWKQAAKIVRKAKTLLAAIGAVAPPSLKLPRTDETARRSLYGNVETSMCSGASVPTAAAQPCQDLRDLLVQGIGSEEEADLNKALSGIADAYGLKPQKS